MKQLFTRTTSLLLICATLLTLLIGCGASNQTVLQGDGIEITEEAYQYWYIQLKDYHVSSYSDVVDDVVFWNSQYDDAGMTYAEFFDQKIRKQIEYYLAGNILFERYDLSLSDTVISNIDQEIDDGINAFGSRSEYDAYLKERYGVSSRSLRKIKIMEQRFKAVYDHLYNAKTGVEKATEAEIEAFYNENYAKINYYMVMKKYDYVYDEKGNRVTDSQNKYQMVSLDEAGQLENKAHAEEVLAKVQAGEALDTFIKKYYADIAAAYPNGFYVLENDNYGAMFTPTVIKAAFSLKENEAILCENEDAYFIVQRYALPDKAYLGSDKTQFESISSDTVEKKFMTKFNEVIGSIETDQSLVEKYSVTTVR